MGPLHISRILAAGVLPLPTINPFATFADPVRLVPDDMAVEIDDGHSEQDAHMGCSGLSTEENELWEDDDYED